MNKKNIGIITGTRAEYGLLKPLIMKLKQDEKHFVKTIATGMHLSPEFGLTYKEIEKDGFQIDEKIEMLLSSDTEVGISKSIGLAIISFSETFKRLNLDCIVVLGDRYEILAASIAATVSKIPVVHLHGGEITEGAYDDAFRHSISKMSLLHFTSTEEYRNRVIQLGESPDRVYNVGAIGLDNIIDRKLMSKSDLSDSIGFDLEKPFALVTFHPVTLEEGTAEIQTKQLIEVLYEFSNLNYIITKANSDNDGRIINKLLEDFERENKGKVKLFTSMGQLRYLSAMKYCKMVIGNSSSGIIEAPSFNIPTINIGDRQKGRTQADTVINCEPKKENILESIKEGLSELECGKYKYSINPYYNGGATEKIVIELYKFLENKKSIMKKFYDLKGKEYV